MWRLYIPVSAILIVPIVHFSNGIPFEQISLVKILKPIKHITMTLVKNNPVYFGNLFDELFNQFPANWGKDAQGTFNAVPANIHETKEGYHVELNAPGRNKEDFKVNLENGLLTISFEKKEETENKDYKTIRKEFNYPSFKRSFSLDEKINTAGIQAKYENGILKVYLPKKEEVVANPQQISIQ